MGIATSFRHVVGLHAPPRKTSHVDIDCRIILNSSSSSPRAMDSNLTLCLWSVRYTDCPNSSNVSPLIDGICRMSAIFCALSAVNPLFCNSVINDLLYSNLSILNDVSSVILSIILSAGSEKALSVIRGALTEDPVGVVRSERNREQLLNRSFTEDAIPESSSLSIAWFIRFCPVVDFRRSRGSCRRRTVGDGEGDGECGGGWSSPVPEV
mmetsp:Transcript_27822/g.54193  ORF Transcript_27822/g.54193 Transcript_27822/m.54193 type:complete len:210 (-) Transcript_27822:2991-3620(-)